jgi:hypothetical protein
MVLVSRHHVDHYLAAGDMENEWDIGLSHGGRRLLGAYWKAERSDKTHRK